MSLPPNVILIGTMGAGKTSTAKELSRLLNYEFWDMDQWIESKNNKKVSEIFKEKGEPFFRDQESKAVEWLRDGQQRVISTGGGVWIDETNRKRLLELGWCVWLKVSAQEALQRIGSNLHQRPLLAMNGDPRLAIARLLSQREPLYALAHSQVDTDGKDPRKVALEIYRALQKIDWGEQVDRKGS